MDEIDRPTEPIEYNQSESKKDTQFETRAVKSNIARQAGIKQAPRVATILEALNTDAGGLLSLCSNKIKAAILKVPQDYIGLDEDEVLKKLKEELNYIPSPTAEAIRTNFWMEFDRCQITHASKMMDKSIYQGACSEGRWLYLLDDPASWHIWAYIVTKPISYETTMHSLLNLATKKLRDILMIPLHKPDGEIRDPKTLDVILKAAAMVDMRAKGGYVQKAETKNLTIMSSHQSVTHTSSVELQSKPIDQLTSDEIQKRLDILNSELAAYDQKKFSTKKEEPVTIEFKEPPEPLLPTTPVQKNAVKRGDGQF